jgi:hypothetical protein
MSCSIKSPSPTTTNQQQQQHERNHHLHLRALRRVDGLGLSHHIKMKPTHIITTLILAAATPSLFADSKSDNSSTSSRKVRVEYVTNYITVPVVCATLDVADVQLTQGHSYRLFVADGERPWKNWGVLRAQSNTAARVWFPVASTRPLLWQLVDVTPGHPQTAIVKQAPDCIAKPQWVVLGPANIRPVK